MVRAYVFVRVELVVYCTVDAFEGLRFRYTVLSLVSSCTYWTRFLSFAFPMSMIESWAFEASRCYYSLLLCINANLVLSSIVTASSLPLPLLQWPSSCSCSLLCRRIWHRCLLMCQAHHCGLQLYVHYVVTITGFLVIVWFVFGWV
jgi:hypothetical protein